MVRERLRDRAGRNYGENLSGEASGQPPERQDLPKLPKRRERGKRVAGGDGISKLDTIVTARRIIIWIYAGVFIGVGLLSGAFFFQTFQEYAQLQRMEAESRQRLAQAEQHLRDQERVLQRLRTDQDYVEKVIRQQLHYARPSELIFRFED
jgi:cell division protein FtsB